jgi:anti-sigma B factor antagonist
MNLRVRRDESHHGVLILTLAGEADPYTTRELRRELDSGVELGPAGVIVDMTQATFVDSTGLGLLVGAAKRLRRRGGELAVVCVDYDVRRIFELTLLDRTFAVVGSLEEALPLLREHHPELDAASLSA